MQDELHETTKRRIFRTLHSFDFLICDRNKHALICFCVSANSHQKVGSSLYMVIFSFFINLSQSVFSINSYICSQLNRHYPLESRNRNPCFAREEELCHTIRVQGSTLD